MFKLKRIYAIWYIFFKNRNTNDIKYLIEISTKSNKTDLINNKRINFLNLIKLIINSFKWIVNANVYYATNYKKFIDLDLYVNKHVLVPRFETELLVDETIKIIKKYNLPTNIIDIGTGSGAIALNLKQHISSSRVDAIDISTKALKIAKKNAFHNNLDIDFKKGNLFNFTSDHNIIISNPPYLRFDEEIDGMVLKTEPHLALFANDQGLECYENILNNYQTSQTRPLLFAFETGINQCEEIKKMAVQKFTLPEIIIKKDLNNIERFIFILIK